MKEMEKSLKTGLSVVITVLLGKLFKIDSLFYAGIAAVICSQVDNIESIKVGIGRIYGTFIGALVGVIFYNYFADSILMLGIGCMIIVFITQKYLKMSQSNIACVVFLAIMVNIDGTNPDHYIIHRITDTTVGVIVSIIVSHLNFSKW
jgi:uncharacterized membrane protein YgaE (UPF0421/DUF939 family)